MTAKFSKEWLYRENMIRHHALSLNLNQPIKWHDEDVYNVTLVHLILQEDEEMAIIMNMSKGIDTNYGKIAFSGFVNKMATPLDHDYHNICIDIEQIESIEELADDPELVSRRKFFKKSAETILPLLATMLISNTFLTACHEEPSQPTYCTHCSNACDDTCHNSCSGCGGTCKGSCGGSCDGSCKATCTYYCGGSCRTGCVETCLQGCDGTCNIGCKESCYGGNW